MSCRYQPSCPLVLQLTFSSVLWHFVASSRQDRRHHSSPNYATLRRSSLAWIRGYCCDLRKDLEKDGSWIGYGEDAWYEIGQKGGRPRRMSSSRHRSWGWKRRRCEASRRRCQGWWCEDE